jgi:hypothetical protein
MLRLNRFAWVSALVVGTSLVACGGGAPKKEVKKTVSKKTTKKTKTTTVKHKKITEEDRAKKRDEAANEVVAAGSTCLPTALKDPESKLTLELGAVGPEAILCAMDHDSSRLLGAAGCWTIDLGAGGLAFRDRAAIPGRGFEAAVEDGCVRGYCPPKDQLNGDAALISWSLDGEQVAVLNGEQIFVFDAKSKEVGKTVGIRTTEQGDKVITAAPKAMWFMGDNIFLAGGDGAEASIWLYKTDGAATGKLLGLGKGNAPVAMDYGSFSVLDKDRVAVAERGFTTLTIFEVASGKRSKLVRKINKGPCHTAEMEKFFSDAGSSLPAKCATHLKGQFDHFLGTTVVAGSKNFLGALTGARIGELAVIDSKNLSEKRSIKLPWCEAAAAAESPAKAMMEKTSSDDAGEKAVEDPDSGGQATDAGEADDAEKPAAKPKFKAKKKSK